MQTSSESWYLILKRDGNPCQRAAFQDVEHRDTTRLFESDRPSDVANDGLRLRSAYGSSGGS